MNPKLEQFARNELKAGLSLCTEEEQLRFKWMYSSKDHDKPINNVVDDMDAKKLDWAMTQVQKTIDKKITERLGPKKLDSCIFQGECTIYKKGRCTMKVCADFVDIDTEL